MTFHVDLKPLRRCVAVSLLMLAAMPAAPAVAQSDQWNALYDRIIRLEHEVRAGQGGGGGNAQIQQQLQQLSAQVGAMQQQMMDMQRELNRLRELERQGLLFSNRRTASVIAPQQQPQQWNQGQVAPSVNQMRQSVIIDGQDNSVGQLPRGGLAPGPQTLGTLVLGDDQVQPYQLSPPFIQQQQYEQQQPQSYQPQYQPQVQPQVPVVPQALPTQQAYQPRQVEGVQSNSLPPPPGAGGGDVSRQQPNGQAMYQLQPGQQAFGGAGDNSEPAFDADGRPIDTMTDSTPSLAPEPVQTALLDGSTGGGNLAAGNSTTGGNLDDAAGRLFLQAKSSYTSRNFNGAVSGLQSFLSKYKEHELADDAQFLLGESYFAQDQWKQAAQSYLTGYQNYPDGNKRGESLLKLAMSLDKLGQKKQACATFAEVNKTFATQANVRNASLKEMKRAGCT